MTSSDNSKKTFCLAPWVHSHVTMSGKRALCCVATPFEEDFDSFEDYWNSPLLKDTRKAMLAGTPPPQYCQACLKPQATEPPTLRFDDFNEESSLLLSNTQEDGTFKGDPIFLDYRYSNICNLSCRMCSPESSSKIEQAFRETSPHLVDNTLKKKKLNSTWIIPELYERCHHDIKQLYFASGEALLQKETWQLLENLISEEKAKEVTLQFHTNLAFPLQQWPRMQETFNAFKEVRFTLSIDGVGADAEFIRDGLKWDHFVTNLHHLKSLVPTIEINQVNITLTLATLLNFRDLINFIEDENLPFMLSYCFTDRLSIMQSPDLLPKELLKQIIEKTSQQIEGLDQIPHHKKRGAITFIQKLQERERPCHSIQELQEIALETLKVDYKLKRPSFLSYYQKSEDLKGWFVETFPPGFQRSYPQNQENHYWPNYISSLDLRGLILLHEDLSTIEEELEFHRFAFGEESVFHLIGSYPSFLNRLLSNAKSDKYDPYHLLRNHKGQFTLINPTYFLLSKVTIPTIFKKFVSIFIVPFLPIIALHFHYQGKVKDFAIEDLSNR